MLIAPGAAIAVLGAGSPAFAADPVPTESAAPIETAPPEEPDLVEGGVGEGQAPPPEDAFPTGKPPKDGTNAQPCEPGWRWESTAKYKDYHKGVGAQQANYNGTSRVARSEFISEVTGEVGIASSVSVKVSGSVLMAEIEGEYNVELSAKLTAKLGNKIAVDTPSKYTTYAAYGVYRLKSAGYRQYLYANCTRGAKTTATVYTPRRVGWAIWEKK
ncbi:hypothetical protein [Streptomyces sp. NPDC060035]|uniref:hypothetical protein n=1 Tax=Streptomyces sp. NPDC060035 TaxID=3347044 RepID=UPI0036AD316D